MLVLPNSSDKIVLQMVERTIVCTCILVFVCFAMVLQTMLTFNEQLGQMILCVVHPSDVASHCGVDDPGIR